MRALPFVESCSNHIQYREALIDTLCIRGLEGTEIDAQISVGPRKGWIRENYTLVSPCRHLKILA